MESIDCIVQWEESLLTIVFEFVPLLLVIIVVYTFDVIHCMQLWRLQLGQWSRWNHECLTHALRHIKRNILCTLPSQWHQYKYYAAQITNWIKKLQVTSRWLPYIVFRMVHMNPMNVQCAHDLHSLWNKLANICCLWK